MTESCGIRGSGAEDQRSGQQKRVVVARVLGVRDVGDRLVRREEVDAGRRVRIAARVDDDAAARMAEWKSHSLIGAAPRTAVPTKRDREGAVRCGDRDVRGVHRRSDDDRAAIVDEIDEPAEVRHLAGDDHARARVRVEAAGAGVVGAVGVVDRDGAAVIDVVLGLRHAARLRGAARRTARGRPSGTG